MADLKISQLTVATTPLAGTEVLPVVQSGTTKKVAVSDLTAGRDVSVLNLAATQTVGTSLGSGGVYLSGDGGPDTGFVGYNYKNISGTESVPVTARASWRQGFLNGFPVEWNVSYRAASAAASAWTKYVVVSSTGDVTASVGNLVIGTAAKGVNFTANTPAAGMTSQLLNWYEEGTFTPTVEGSTTAGTATYAYQIGRYTRTGNRVSFTIRVGWSGGTGTGNLLIAGLPYAAANVSVGGYSSVHVFAAAASNMTLTAGNIAIATLGPNSTKLSIEQQPSDTAVAYDGAAAIIITGTYEV